MEEADLRMLGCLRCTGLECLNCFCSELTHTGLHVSELILCRSELRSQFCDLELSLAILFFELPQLLLCRPPGVGTLLVRLAQLGVALEM